MNRDRIEGGCKQLKGRVRVQWARLTDNDLDLIAGERDRLVGKVQEWYGIGRDEAGKEVERFGAGLRDDDRRRYS